MSSVIGPLESRPKCADASCKRAALSFADRCWDHLDAGGRRQLRQEIVSRVQTHSLKGVYLAGADLSGLPLAGADFSGSMLEKVSLRGTSLQNADLSRCRFKGADLALCRLRNSNLESAHLTGVLAPRADFRDTRLDGANLTYSRLQAADLRGASLTESRLRGAWLCYVLWTDARGFTRSNIEIEGSDLKRMPRQAQTAYRGLKIHFQNRGLYRDEEWALLHEKRNTREVAAIDGQHAYRAALHAWNVLAGHGTRLHYAFGWALMILVAFSFAYWPNPWGWKGLVKLECDRGLQCHGFLKAFYFSVVTFATLGFGDIHPVNTWGVIAVIGEVLSGYLMLGVLVATVVRKMTR